MLILITTIFLKHFKKSTTDGQAAKQCKYDGKKIIIGQYLSNINATFYTAKFHTFAYINLDFVMYRNDFADYADFCFKTFGDRVKNWMTFNEPRVVAALGYDTGFFAPGRCSKTYGNCTAGNSATEPYIVAHNLILCHASAVQRYRTKYQVRFMVLYFFLPLILMQIVQKVLSCV